MEDWNPGRLLKLSGGYWGTCALHAGVKLDLFTKIGDRKVRAKELAGELGADARGLGMLLNALAALELIKKSGEAYENVSGAKEFLAKDSPDYIGYLIMHHHYLMDSWVDLARAVKDGGPIRDRAPDSPEGAARREAFLMGMFNSAMNFAPMIVPKLDLSGKRSLLDMGGGPGTYAIMFCRRYPELRATVFDLPTTRPFAEKTIERFGLSDRVRFLPGDYIKDEIEGKYDAAWLSHILHAEGPGGCREIIRKAVAALNPGGLIMVHDFFLRDTMDGPPFPALFALNMLLGTDAGQAYSEGQVREMLADAGVRDIRRVPVSTPNDSGVLAGVK
ncbi:MAG: methyltransferase [Elusimicrobiota bacterium]